MKRTLFQHVDGGFYRFKGLSKSSVDQSLWVVYEHLWPFEADPEVPFWVRPLNEWTKPRFVEVTEAALEKAMTRDRLLAQAEIISNRMQRKYREKK